MKAAALSVLVILVIYFAFCAYLVHEGHWIVGSLLGLFVMCLVTVKSGGAR